MYVVYASSTHCGLIGAKRALSRNELRFDMALFLANHVMQAVPTAVFVMVIVF